MKLWEMAFFLWPYILYGLEDPYPFLDLDTWTYALSSHIQKYTVYDYVSIDDR